MAIWQHELLRELIPESLDGVVVPVGPALALTQVPLEQVLIGLQVNTQLCCAGIGLLQAQGEGLYA